MIQKEENIVLDKITEGLKIYNERLIKTKKARHKCINEAIDYYNRKQRRLMLEKKLKEESNLVKDESMNVLKDFDST